MIFSKIATGAKIVAIASAGLVASMGAASSATLLTVDVSDPSAVTFTGTGAAADVATSVDAFVGISLLDFYSSVPTGFAVAGSSTLTAGTNADLLDGEFRAGSAVNFLGSLVVLNFTTTDAAFSGTFTVDYTANASFLPSVGTTGSIVTGDNLFQAFGDPFGEWAVIAPVPLPAGFPLLALGLGALYGLKRRSRAAA
ncbi:MAG: VPLPA-CTERM sorting domain-containing protein [Pseudomonadota bacterium]